MVRFVVSRRFSVVWIGLLSMLFINCNNSDNVTGNYSFVQVYNQKGIDSIISNNDTTVIFLWTEWCNASRSVFKKHVIPFIEQKADNIGFISVFYGKEETLATILQDNQCFYPTYCLTSYSGIDKINIYYLLNSSVKNYKLMNFVPVSIICDKNGNILNYEEETNEYSHIVDCIWRINK
jgi:hypothetical protein